MAEGRLNSDGSSSIRPASILDRSRMSLMRDSRCRPDSRMSARYSACLSLISPNIRSASTSEKPMIALSGVRSSCDMLARNSLLCRLATSSCRPLSSISRKSRAFWMASADCVAKVLRRSITCGANSPAVFRFMIEPAQQAVLAQQRNRQQRPIAEAKQDLAHPALCTCGRPRCRGSAPARPTPPGGPARLRPCESAWRAARRRARPDIARRCADRTALCASSYS